jgi:chitinase
VEFLIKHNLDGLDFDWEYPALQGDNNVVRDEDKENFVAMLESFREALDSLGKQDETHYLMTIASGGFRKYLEVNDLKAAAEYLDFINIMSYDFYTAGDATTGHHANLFPNGAKGRSASTTVQEHMEFGIPAEKIVMGVPFYGRMWHQVDPTDHGLFQSGQFKRGLPYSAIQELMQDSTYVRYWDEKAAAPYLYSKRDSAWITFEDEESMARKMNFIKENGLGGAMFWELSEDPSQSLLNTMYQEMSIPSHSEN